MSPAITNDTDLAALNAPTIFIVDENPAVRETLGSLARYAGWQSKIFSSARQFLGCPRQWTPGCAIVNIKLLDLNGLELQRLIADRPEMPIIFLANSGDVRTTVEAMKAGAWEVLTEPFNNSAMLTAIGSAFEHSRAALICDADRQVTRARYNLLTHREREVFDLVVEGMLNKLIGFKLGISEVTVKMHRGNMMRKMKARSLADLIHIATRLALAKDYGGGVRLQSALAHSTVAPWDGFRSPERRINTWQPAQ